MSEVNSTELWGSVSQIEKESYGLQALQRDHIRGGTPGGRGTSTSLQKLHLGLEDVLWVNQEASCFVRKQTK